MFTYFETFFFSSYLVDLSFVVVGLSTCSYSLVCFAVVLSVQIAAFLNENIVVFQGYPQSLSAGEETPETGCSS